MSGNNILAAMRSWGIEVHVTPDVPKMTLMDELIPGIVPLPSGFKAEVDAWMLEFFGTTNLLKDGDTIMVDPSRVGMPGSMRAHMNPRTLELLERATVFKEPL